MGAFYCFLDGGERAGYAPGMPRTARAGGGGGCYHVPNRGNGRTRVFRGRHDYAAFFDLLGRSVPAPAHARPVGG